MRELSYIEKIITRSLTLCFAPHLALYLALFFSINLQAEQTVTRTELQQEAQPPAQLQQKTESLQAPELKGKSEKKFEAEFYSEVYSSPLTETSNQFERLRVLYAADTFVTPFLGLENYTSEGSRNSTLELGFKKSFFGWQILGGLRKEKINEASLAFWNVRLGAIYSNYWQLPWENVFADAYAESFANQYESQRAAVSIAAWAKVGYRLYQKDHLFLDPAIVGLRGYDNSDRALLGSDYQMIQAGLQAGCYYENPMISSTIILTKSWSRSQAAPVVNAYWLLWAVEVKF